MTCSINTQLLSIEDQNILGEVCNISMGAAATALSIILNQRVVITTPKVTVLTWDGLRQVYGGDSVGVRASYREGLSGSNILILRNRDAKIIADIMMGGTGQVQEPVTLSEMELSAVSEAMNQMIGSSATALTIIDNKKIAIGIPETFAVTADESCTVQQVGFASDKTVAMVDFRIEVGDLINSEVVQIMHMDTAQELIDALKKARLKI